MAAHSTTWIQSAMAILCIISLIQNADPQIPTACTDDNSLRNMVCCPDNCGEAEGRGQCVDIPLPPTFNMTSTDVRRNWPHYFTRACECNGNYWGFDCSRCTYGHFGDNCMEKQIIARASLEDRTSEDWIEHNQIINLTRTYDSGYSVVLEECVPGTPNIMKASVTVYQLFIWLHHYSAKDNPVVDYAHEGTGFPTWHRYQMLWLEWEIQYMLKSTGKSNYYTFRLHYWDWRSEIQSRDFERHATSTQAAIIIAAFRDGGTDIYLFNNNTLGETIMNSNGQPQVYGDLFGNGWNTICWYGGSGNIPAPRNGICNPNVNTGPLLRCPINPKSNLNVCNLHSSNWPDTEDVNNAINKPLYDTENYGLNVTGKSFRSFLEGFDASVSVEECAGFGLCKCGDRVDCDGDNSKPPVHRRLHNTVHIILGIGDFRVVKELPPDKQGVMADVAASPNDPVFINHHAMVDCILEEWLQKNPNASYPDNVPADRLPGHQADAYIVPFFPLVRHSDVFKTADNLGYSCRLESHAEALEPLNWAMLIFFWGALVLQYR